MMTRSRAATLALVFFLAIAGCDTTEPESDTGASGNVEGAIQVPGQDPQDFRGTVYFAEGIDEETEMQGFGLYAEPNGDSEFSGSRAILFHFADRPDTKTYTIVPSSEAENADFTGEIQIKQQDGRDLNLSADSGELTIQTSTSERVKGSFTLKAEQPPFGSATVKGSFDAGRREGAFEVPTNR